MWIHNLGPCIVYHSYGVKWYTILLFPFPKYLFKSPGLDQEKSAYGDETVRYLQIQMYIIYSKLTLNSGLYNISCVTLNLITI